MVLFGTSYWNPLRQWLIDQVLAEGYISEKDLDMFQVTDSVDEAVALVTNRASPGAGN